MNILNILFRKSFWIAAFCLIAGFIFMAAGNTAICQPNSFVPLTLAPVSLIAGYSFVVVGIMKREI